MRLAALLVFCSLLSSQEIPQAGGIVQVPFRCTQDDMDQAGMSCSEDEPCPVYLELTAVESVGNKIFAAGNIHSAANTLYSVLLASDDAGRTWREVFERVRGAGLDHIQFIDFENGWVSGEVLTPFAQDPFLLITSDGGKTWRRRPVFSESRSGSIQQFWFSSRNNGSLIIDRGAAGEGGRYELYESPNGGETWMVREASEQPLKIKRAIAPVSAWRIHADAASKSFRIERQSASDAWAPVAAFAVPLPACKPQPMTEAAPPSEEEKPADAVPTLVVQPRRPGPPPSLRHPPQ